MKYQLFYTWAIAFLFNLFTTLLEVWEDSQSSYWLNKQCHTQEDFRTNMKKECLLANDRLKNGLIFYIATTYVNRVKWCFTYSCFDLWNIAINDTWAFIKTVAIILLCSPFFWDLFVKKAKTLNENRKNQKHLRFMEQMQIKEID